jgi:hypothetical protein
MHPIFATGRRLALYLLGWVPAGCLIAGIAALVSGRPFLESVALHLPPALGFAFVCLSAWPVCRSFSTGSTPPVRLIGVFGSACVLAAAAWAILAAVWTNVLHRVGFPGSASTAPPVPMHRDLILILTLGALLYLLSLAAHSLLMALDASRAAEQRALEAAVLARDSELKALRAQINPHFLFNSLNSISALTTTDPGGARRMCQRLSDFMRSTLTLGTQAAVPLSGELALVENYLAIEQVRFGERLAVETEVDPGALPCLVPPLLLQPLVENAVRHGVSGLVDGGTVRVSAAARDGRLEIVVRNFCDPDRPAKRGTGTGLRNVQARLEALYPGRSRVDVNALPDRFSVTLDFPAVTP